MNKDLHLIEDSHRRQPDRPYDRLLGLRVLIEEVQQNRDKLLSSKNRRNPVPKKSRFLVTEPNSPEKNSLSYTGKIMWRKTTK